MGSNRSSTRLQEREAGAGGGQSTPSRRHYETEKRSSRHRERGKDFYYEELVGGKEILGTTSLFVLPTLMALARVSIHPAASIVDVVQGPLNSRGGEDRDASDPEPSSLKKNSADRLKSRRAEHIQGSRVGRCKNHTRTDCLPVVACERCRVKRKQRDDDGRGGDCRCCCLSSRASAAAVRCLYLGEAILVQGEQQGRRRRDGRRGRRRKNDREHGLQRTEESRLHNRKRKSPCEPTSNGTLEHSTGTPPHARDDGASSVSVGSLASRNASASGPSCPTCSLTLSDWPEAEVMSARRLQGERGSHPPCVDQDVAPESALWSFLMEADMRLMRAQRRRAIVEGPLQNLPTLREVVVSLAKCPVSSFLTHGNAESVGSSMTRTAVVSKQGEAPVGSQREGSCSGDPAGKGEQALGAEKGSVFSQACHSDPRVSSGSTATDGFSSQSPREVGAQTGVSEDPVRIEIHPPSPSAAGEEGVGNKAEEEDTAACFSWGNDCETCGGDDLKNSGPFSHAELQDILAALAPLADAHAVVETHVLLHALTFRLACFGAPLARDFHAVHAAISSVVRETSSFALSSREDLGEGTQRSLPFTEKERQNNGTSEEYKNSSQTAGDDRAPSTRVDRTRNKLEAWRATGQGQQQLCPSCTASLTAEKLQDLLLSLPLLRCLLLASQSVVPAIRQTALDFLHARLPPFCPSSARGFSSLQRSCPRCVRGRERLLPRSEEEGGASLDKAAERLLVLLQLGDAWKVVGGRPGVLPTIITLVLMASEDLQVNSQALRRRAPLHVFAPCG